MQKLPLVQISRLYVQLGYELPYNLYNSESKLVLSKGFIVNDIHKIQRFIKVGLYRNLQEKDDLNFITLPDIKTSEKCPFDIIDNVIKQLGNIFFIIFNQIGQVQNVEAELFKLAKEIRRSCDIDFDATLATIFLPNTQLNTPYSIKHPIDTAIVSVLVGKTIGFNDEELNLLVASCLVMNIGLLDIQDQLHVQSEALTEEQKERIYNHPILSRDVLRNAKVENKILLQAVKQHHEQQDGKGYPRQTEGSKISPFAQIISVSDIYTAMLTDKAYRSGLLPNLAMKELFIDRGQHIHEKLTKLFIKELGIYPPGSIVQLANLETAVVLKRTLNVNCPHVVTILSPKGEPTLPINRQTSLEQFKITNTLFSKDIKMKLSRHTLWGYVTAYKTKEHQEDSSDI